MDFLSNLNNKHYSQNTVIYNLFISLRYFGCYVVCLLRLIRHVKKLFTFIFEKYACKYLYRIAVKYKSSMNYKV